MHTITIIGVGKVGGSVALAAEAAGMVVQRIPHTAVEQWFEQTPPLGEIVVIAVADTVLQYIVHKLCERFQHNLNNVLCIHTNGSMRTGALAPLEEYGAEIAAMHPYQTFIGADARYLKNILWGVDCAAEVFIRCEQLAQDLGGKALHLQTEDEDARRRYHASAVAASNFVYAALSLARDLALSVGMNPAEAIEPILRQTVENGITALQEKSRFPVTGPLIRGDVRAVQQQQRAMPKQLREVYNMLSMALLETVQDQIPSNVAEELRARLALPRALKEKVVICILNSKKEILVFDHVYQPEAGIQIPKGSIDKYEPLHLAAERELREESGLSSSTPLVHIFSEQHFKTGVLYHVYTGTAAEIHEPFTHIVTGKGNDAGLHFRYYWMGLETAQKELVWYQQDIASRLLETLTNQ